MKKYERASNGGNPSKKENDLSYDSIFSYLDQIDASDFITIPEESEPQDQSAEGYMNFISILIGLIGTIEGMFF